MMLKSLCLGALTLWAAPAAAEVTIFAAASLKGPLDRVIEGLEEEVVVSYGGSGALARQVSMGAPADIVFLAHPVWMDTPEAAGALVEGTRALVLRNRLVLVGAAGAPEVPLTTEGLAEALGDGRLATGFVEAVPAGQYAKQALDRLDLWDGVADRLAEVDNVRAALALVARGEAPLGAVYATDAAITGEVAVVAIFPEDSHDPIVYEAALTAGAAPGAAEVLSALSDDAADRLFEDAGFLPAGAE